MTAPEPEQAPEQHPITASVVVQMRPLWRIDRPGQTFNGDLNLYAQQLTAYFAQNLAQFADSRGGDLLVIVQVSRGDESAGHQYRDGAYVKDEPGEVPS